MSPNKRLHNGFTLVEVVLALAILSLLLLGVSMALRTGVLAWEK
jgi:prepilin-type N-terminal cleavage/methylation domain-containing protein